MAGGIHPSMRMVIATGRPDVVNTILCCAQGCCGQRDSPTQVWWHQYGPRVSGMWALVVRRPCLTQHHAQPMTADVRDVDSVQFPVCFCSQNNADFDGDEVHLHP
jgi:hypothetical protein